MKKPKPRTPPILRKGGVHQKSRSSHRQKTRRDLRHEIAHLLPKEILLRITTPYYCAGVVYEMIDGDWKVTHTAPILAWARDKTLDELKGWVERKQFHWVQSESWEFFCV